MARPKTPTAILEANGAFVKNPQRRRPSEPRPDVESPDPPQSVIDDAVALAKWHELVGMLVDLRIIGRIDKDLIENYCLTYSDMLSNVKLVREEGQLIDGARGGMVRNPRTQVLATQRNQLLKMQTEMGMTPASRPKLQVAEKEDDGMFSELMKRRDSIN